MVDAHLALRVRIPMRLGLSMFLCYPFRLTSTLFLEDTDLLRVLKQQPEIRDWREGIHAQINDPPEDIPLHLSVAELLCGSIQNPAWLRIIAVRAIVRLSLSNIA